MVCLKCDHRRSKASTSSESRLQNGGYQESSRFSSFQGDHSSVNIQTSSWGQGQNRNIGANMWRSAEEEIEEHGYPNSRNEASVFADFPIIGGLNDLSQNAEKRDRWKLEMIRWSKVNFKAKRNDELSSANFHRRLEFPKSADDDEMAEWFGPGK